MLKKLLFISLLFSLPYTLSAQDTNQNYSLTGHVVSVYSIQQFDTLLQEYDRVVVDFYAPWCGPCNRMSPLIEQLAQELDTILFLKINVDTIKQLSSRYNIMSIPTFMFFKNGTRVYRFKGMRSKSAMKKEILSRLG